MRADQLERQNPYLSDWTLSIQREITPTLLAEVGYVGSKMTHFSGTGRTTRTILFAT